MAPDSTKAHAYTETQAAASDHDKPTAPFRAGDWLTRCRDVRGEFSDAPTYRVVEMRPARVNGDTGPVFAFEAGIAWIADFFRHATPEEIAAVPIRDGEWIGKFGKATQKARATREDRRHERYGWLHATPDEWREAEDAEDDDENGPDATPYEFEMGDWAVCTDGKFNSPTFRVGAPSDTCEHCRPSTPEEIAAVPIRGDDWITPRKWGGPAVRCSGTGGPGSGVDWRHATPEEWREAEAKGERGTFVMSADWLKKASEARLPSTEDPRSTREVLEDIRDAQPGKAPDGAVMWSVKPDIPVMEVSVAWRDGVPVSASPIYRPADDEALTKAQAERLASTGKVWERLRERLTDDERDLVNRYTTLGNAGDGEQIESKHITSGAWSFAIPGGPRWTADEQAAFMKAAQPSFHPDWASLVSQLKQEEDDMDTVREETTTEETEFAPGMLSEGGEDGMEPVRKTVTTTRTEREPEHLGTFAEPVEPGAIFKMAKPKPQWEFAQGDKRWSVPMDHRTLIVGAICAAATFLGSVWAIAYALAQ